MQAYRKDTIKHIAVGKANMGQDDVLAMRHQRVRQTDLKVLMRASASEISLIYLIGIFWSAQQESNL